MIGTIANIITSQNPAIPETEEGIKEQTKVGENDRSNLEQKLNGRILDEEEFIRLRDYAFAINQAREANAINPELKSKLELGIPLQMAKHVISELGISQEVVDLATSRLYPTKEEVASSLSDINSSPSFDTQCRGIERTLINRLRTDYPDSIFGIKWNFSLSNSEGFYELGIRKNPMAKLLFGKFYRKKDLGSYYNHGAYVSIQVNDPRLAIALSKEKENLENKYGKEIKIENTFDPEEI